MIRIKTPEQIARMRESGRIAALVLDAVAREVSPGVRTADLDAWARDLIGKHGARSAFKGYRGYPSHICVSVNEEVVHGIPGPRMIRAGDLVSLDVGIEYQGWCGDNARSVLAGVSDPATVRLVQVATLALEAAIAAAVDGGWLTDVSRAVQTTAEAAGFSVVREFVGHGIGRAMHEDPQVPNFVAAGRKPHTPLRPGMTLAIEPMVNLGRPEVDVLADRWTVVTRDRRPSAHVEHTVAVCEHGPEVLTRLE